EKVGRHEDLHMRADALLPRGGGLALWRGRNAMALEDVAHGLVTHGMPQIGQCPDDAIVAPGAILLGSYVLSRPPALVRWGDALEPCAVWSRQTSALRVYDASRESCRV